MTPERVDEIPDSLRPGHWVLPHWVGATLQAGITDATLDLRVRDRPPRDVQLALEQLTRVFPDMAGVVVAPQVHGIDRIAHTDISPGATVSSEADGHSTRLGSLLLAVTVADCVPVYLRHDPTNWIGLLHAGWRGIANGILETTIGQLRSGGLPTEDLVIHCGVSICGSCYEVGPEVHRALSCCDPGAPAPLDLRGILAGRAAAAGVRAVTVSGLCTREHPDFHSHRGSGGAPHRMAAYLGRSQLDPSPA